MLVFNEAGFARWLGVAFTTLGFTLIYGSGVALGKQYSPDVTIQAGHQLVTKGIYRYIRHPRYLGMICLIDWSILLISVLDRLGLRLYFSWASSYTGSKMKRQ